MSSNMARLKRIGVLSVVVPLFLIGMGSAAHASDNYAYMEDSAGGFGIVDLTTGIYNAIYTPIPTGGNLALSAGLGEANGSLYGGYENSSVLYSVSTLGATAGSVTAIGTGTNGEQFVDGFGSTTSGLYALDYYGNLLSVSPTTGESTLIGASNLQRVISQYSLSTGSSALYFALNYNLYQINTQTGAPTLIGPLGGSGPNIQFFAMVEVGGTLYGVDSDQRLYTVNTSTGLATYSVQIVSASAPTTPYGNNIVGLAPYAPPALQFIPMTPCRVVDTRSAAGLLGSGSAAAPVSGNTARSFSFPSSTVCNIPSTAAAYSLNVTVVPHAGLGYLTVWPTGVAQPVVSTLNSDGRVKANAAIVPAGTSGAISVYATDTTDLVLDINGYFVSATSTSALAFYPLTPCRVADTRNATGSLGGPSLVGMQTRAFPIQSSGCGIPSTAQAYSLNFTAVPQDGLGYLSAWPTGQTWPGVSTLNVSPNNPVVANAAIVPAGTGGEINVLGSNNTDVVIDINGYFAPAGSAAGGQALFTVTPCRVLDTRSSSGSFNGALPVNVASSSCGIPSSAEAFVLNATVVPTGGLGYLTLWPENEAQPLVSTLNADDGVIASNMAIVPTTNGAIDAFSSNSTQLILDISGYFAPSSTH